ncbi:MAG: chemotaxis protein CheB [Geminicoccaceae bacterium]
MAEFPIVGIGSSAGGLEALEKLFGAMPPDSGLGFVVVAHLDPTQESHLSELLSRDTKMPVVEVGERTAVEPGHVYVIAPDRYLTLKDGVLHPSEPGEPRGQRRAIDVFLRSLAEDQGERAIGIVLSGTGTDGTQGLRAIKAEGGIALAQDPETADFGGMPQSAIATGGADLVLAPEKMAEALLDLVRHPYLRRPAEVEKPPEIDGHLTAVLSLVRAGTKQDFRCYKRTTLLRRIHRRMGLRQIVGLDDYIERLRDDPGELAALARDLTITVSGFFRDPEAWKVLDQKVIAPLVAERPADAAIRVWVPGCATGEEAYSIAMLVVERAEAVQKSFDLKIFATDVSEHVLPVARAGLYPASIAQDISRERLERFFDREDDSYRIKRELGDAITLAPQNLMQDPPFSRLDVISCRNLLIYLEPEIQKKLLGLFHFALREGGHLFLGPAETAAAQGSLFQPISKKWRIYLRLGPTRHDVTQFPLLGPRQDPNEAASAPPAEPRARASTLFERALLEQYAPAAVLIDHRFNVPEFHGPTGDYLQQPGGEPTSNLLALARDGLQAPLRAAVQKAIHDDQEVTVDVRVRRGGSLHPVRLVVRPLRPPAAAGMLAVSFLEREPVPQGNPTTAAAERLSPSQLEAELNATREELRLFAEQMETSNEELQASNEEIRSINEELQASNEELETSKEELQSLNEELHTVNSQLQAKVQELETRTNDLNNLLNSTEIATLFLDANLRIRWFTPAMKGLLDFMPADIGRPVSHFAQRFLGGDLAEDAKEVLERLVPRMSEVAGDSDRAYLRNTLPYRTEDNRIAGVVVTFTEITERKHWEQEIQAAREFAESIVETVRTPLLVLTPDLRVRSANASFYRTYQVGPEETVDRPIYELGNRQWDIPQLRRLLDEVLPTDKRFDEFEVEHAFETIGQRTMLLNARRIEAAQLILLAIEDITERKRSEDHKELLARELSHRVKNTLAVVQALATQTNGSRSIKEFRESFVGRLHAMARTHSILLDAQWRGTELQRLVEQALGPYRLDQPAVMTIEGEPVTLTANQGLGLSLILHELATNAVKYGALSDQEGRVHLSWRLEDGNPGRRVRLLWQERGGPPVEPPGEKGFGMRLIERACTYELEGEVELEYVPDGLRCEVVFPLT